MGRDDPTSYDPGQPSVSWTVGSPERTAEGFLTQVTIEILNAEAAKNLAVLVKAGVPLKQFCLYEEGPELIEQSPSRRLRDGRELIVTDGRLAGRYLAKVTTEEFCDLEAEAVLDVPFWGS